VVGSLLLCAVTLRIFGETDINLAGPIGHVTQFIFAPLVPGNAAATLGTGGLTEGGMSIAGDMLQDLKTGHLIGTPVRKQFVAQLLGVVTGCMVIVPVFFIFKNAYGLDSEFLPTPNAKTYASLATALAHGVAALPRGTGMGMAAAAGAAVVLALMGQTRWGRWLPSTTGIGVAALIPASYSVTILAGALLIGALGLAARAAKDSDAPMLAASGLIAGESIVGVIIAGLVISGII